MVVHCYDYNDILIRTIKNRTGNELNSTLEYVFKHIEEKVFKLKFHAIDNEAAINTIKMIKRKR